MATSQVRMIEWEFAYALPNLRLSSSSSAADSPSRPSELGLGIPYLTIASSSDPRVKGIVAREPRLQDVVDGFRGSTGQRLEVALMLVRADAPASVKRSEPAIIAFRNLLAISHLIPARGRLRTGSSTGFPLYSETFDVYPIAVGRRGHLISSTPAASVVYSSTARFEGHGNEYLGAPPSSFRADSLLAQVGSLAWRRAFDSPRGRKIFPAALLRSVEAAYAASRLGTTPNPSVHEVGIQIALWVSAIEILAWPFANEANLGRCWELLGSYRWFSRNLNAKRYHAMHRGIRYQLNAIQRAYYDLYRARNDFLHGERVDAATLTLKSPGRAPLSLLAAIVFRTAVAAYSQRAGLADKRSRRVGGVDISHYADDYNYTTSLKRHFGLLPTT
jgi:hypothetical protein